MAERKGGDGSFRTAVGEVLRAPIEFALEQRQNGPRWLNRAYIAVIIAAEFRLASPVINLIGQEGVVAPQDFLPIVGNIAVLNVLIYAVAGLGLYSREHHLG